jgi:hypothetical protein
MAVDLAAIARQTTQSATPSWVDLSAIAQQTLTPQQAVKPTIWQSLKASARQFVAPIVWWLQWLSDVWQRTVGRPIDFAARQVAWRITGTTPARWELTRWDITVPVLWEELAGWMWTRIGRWVGQFAGSAALTAPLWWIAWAGINMWLWQWVSLLTRMWITALKWAATGWIWTQSISLATRDRPATLWETAIWAWVWWLIGWVGWWIWFAKESKLTSMLTEAQTSRTLKNAAGQWRLKFTQPWLFSKWWWQITPTERAANAIEIVKKEIPSPAVKDPQKLIEQMDALWRQEYAKLSNQLKDIKIGSMTQQKASLKKEVLSILDDSDWRKFFASPTKQKQFATIIEDINKARTADDLWKIRTNFDKLFPDSVKNPQNFQAETLNSLWKDIRNQMNDVLDDIVIKSGEPSVKTSFYKMSSLLEWKDNLISNIPKLAAEQQGAFSKKDLWKYIVWAGAALLFWKAF